MAIAKSLVDVDPFFMQSCPLCSRLNRMVVKGVYVNGDKREIYPDMGYSFCNCEDIFYTRPENAVDPISNDTKDGIMTVIQPDPFFCEWAVDPYAWTHWNPRKYEILFDFYGLQRRLVDYGFEILSAHRDFDVQSPTLQHFIITARKQ